MDLFRAIEAEDLPQVRALLATDPTLSAMRTTEGISAVMAARYRQRPDLVDLILETGPELDIFDAAALGRIDRLTELLGAHPELANAWATDGFTPLSLASFFGQPEAVGVLLRSGADVGAVSHNAMEVQPLHAATAARNAEAVRLLLDAGADPDARQHGGWTPIAAARHAGDDVIADLLLAHGAKPEPDPDPDPEPEPEAEQAGAP